MGGNSIMKNKQQAQPETRTDDYGIVCTETRKIPTGGGSNIIASRQGYEREMKYRRERNPHVAFPYPLPTWDELEITWKSGDTAER